MTIKSEKYAAVGVRLMHWSCFPLEEKHSDVYQHRSLLAAEPEKRIIIADIRAATTRYRKLYHALIRLNKEYNLCQFCLSKAFKTQQEAMDWADKELIRYGFILISEKQAVLL